jgi:WD40 repeat protein
MGTSSKNESEISLWDFRKLGNLVCKSNNFPQSVCDFDFDSSCDLLAMGLSNGQVNVWDTQTGTSAVHAAHNASVKIVKWDIWANSLFSGDEEGTFFVWI